ncbi:unnamed protein product [Hermetia illucens]|uniref:Deoxyribonuclease TATDN1 n=1 Tax=Hermetia illucens TaxID=343691 RepID=A0A7R8YWA1_HERIL|nr:putative deoxyribonuclease TATDN1 isoform X1 [Hermetia illucens]CAD7087708.1 unnamed protein product [Hermetia illucens]
MKIAEKFLKMGLRFIDIGANLTDPMFQGFYGGSQKHPADLDRVLDRAWQNGLDKIIITVGTLNEFDGALNLASTDSRLYVTMGCHPTRCGEFEPDPDLYYSNMCKSIEANHNRVVAIGECGLDYDRLKFCPKEVQKVYFEKQLELAEQFQLPLFLHCRSAHEDFMEIVTRNRSKIVKGGVVHSFDGTSEEARKIIDFGFYIGLNGCSLKTEENLKTVQEIPLEKIMIETDCPWCGIRPSHAGSKMVKTRFPTIKKKEKWAADQLIDGRNEPCHLRQVIEVIANVHNEPVEKLADIFYENTINLFFRK